MTEIDPYLTPAGVEAAIKDAARRAHAADPSLTVGERIRLEYFRRFLSRIFSEGESSEWVLKGGTGMLARVPSTRSTLDIDLYRRGFTLTQALADLRRLAQLDLGDHFRFVYTRHTDTIGGDDDQPYIDGYRVTFDVYVGVQKKGALHVDLAIGAGLTGPVTTLEPAGALPLPRLTSNPYRLYPVVDQVADKVCATMKLYNGQPSSREKDLIDLVVLAVTHEVDGTSLAHAIAQETARRQMEPFTGFVIPRQWGRAYRNLAKGVKYCANYQTVDQARDLVTGFINPALNGTVDNMTWVPEQRGWNPSETA